MTTADVVGTVAVITAGILTCPFEALPLGSPGIDSGWQWVVNVAADHGWAFGRDVVFTYGPLGWLATPQDAGHHLILANGFRIALQGLLITSGLMLLARLRRPVPVLEAGPLARISHQLPAAGGDAPRPAMFSHLGVLNVPSSTLPRSSNRKPHWTRRLSALVTKPDEICGLVFAALWTVAGTVGLRFEGFICLVVALLMLTSLRARTAWPAVTAGLITGIVPFVKTSLGITTAATIMVGTGLIWKHRGPKVPVLAVTAFGATAALLVVTLFPSLAVFRAWIGQALEVVGGYAVAASIVGPRPALVAGALLLFGVIGGGILLTRRAPDFGSTALILAPGLLITFRLAFVRQDGHQYLFVPFVAALLGVAALGASRRAAMGLLVGGLTAVGIGTISGALPFPPAALPRIVALGHRGPANIARIVHFKETRNSLSETSGENLQALRLPSSWIDRMAAAPHGITVIPWELMYAPANDLPFRPLRSMQLYSAYTPELDRLTAEGLSDPEAPDFVLDDFAPVGKRRALLDAPATWKALYLGYRLELFDPDRGLLLLGRRPKSLGHTWQNLGAGSLEIGGPGISVPPSPHMVFAEIDAPLNTFGRLNKAFFRVPLLMAVFHRIDGGASWARLIPATAPAGILVSHFPHDIDGYAGLWSGRGPVPVSRLQVAGPGEQNYVRHATIRWQALVIGNEAEGKAPQPVQVRSTSGRGGSLHLGPLRNTPNRRRQHSSQH